MTAEATDLVTIEQTPTSLVLSASDPIRSMDKAQELIQYMSSKCTGEHYIANINRRQYPKVEWWTTVGMALGIFPIVVSNSRLDRDGEVIYEATVELRLNGEALCRAEAICSNKESRWRSADEYAIKSMAATRATGKAFRLGLSGLAVLAGLEGTNAEEMPADGGLFDNQPKQGASETIADCPEHSTAQAAVAWRRSPKQKEAGMDWSHKVEDGALSFWCERNRFYLRSVQPDLKANFDSQEAALAWVCDKLQDEFPLVATTPWEQWSAEIWQAIDRNLTKHSEESEAWD